MATDSAYNFIRSRPRNKGAAGFAAESMQGRAPSFANQRGGGQFIRGFRSRPGAPHSANDSMNNLTGMNRGADGFTDSADWGNFFKGNSPEGVRQGYAPNSQAIADAAGVGQAESPTDYRLVEGGTNRDGPISFSQMGNAPETPSLLTDPEAFGSLSTPETSFGAIDAREPQSAPPDYLGSVISNAQQFLRRNRLTPNG